MDRDVIHSGCREKGDSELKLKKKAEWFDWVKVYLSRDFALTSLVQQIAIVIVSYVFYFCGTMYDRAHIPYYAYRLPNL